MKKLKNIGGFVLGLLVLCILFSFGFKTKEYLAGKKYVEYWVNNPNLFETVNQNEEFDFNIFEKSAIDNDLILFGEYHGTKETIKIDFNLLST